MLQKENIQQRIIALLKTGLICMACFFVIAIGASVSNDGSDASIVSSLMIWGMVVLTICMCLKGLKPLRRIIKQLNAMTVWMSQEHQSVTWKEMSQKDSLFGQIDLDSMFNSYCNEMERLHKDNEEHIHCDIASYISEDQILEVCHGQVLEQIPSMLTGLGILGTFIGLALGLQGFDNSTVDKMITSITPLLDGIKVAFYTSISGVILSLLFNFSLKLMTGKLARSLDSFYTVFYENVVPIPVNDLANQMLRIQQEQSESMRGFAETIAEEMAKSFATIAAPTFESIGSTMESLSMKMETTMDALSSQISTKQSESMGMIVESFIQQMNASMAGSFDALKDSIEQLCSNQREAQERTVQLIEQLGTTVNHVQSMNDASSHIVTNMEEYSTKLNQFQSGVNKAYYKLEQQEEMFEGITKKQTQCLDSFVVHEVVLSEVLKNLMEREKGLENTFKTHANSLEAMVQSQSKALKQMYETYKSEYENAIENQTSVNKESFAAAAEHMKQTTQYLEEVNVQLQKMSNVFNKNMRDSVDLTFEQFDSGLSDIAMHFSGTISEINEVSQNIPRALQSSFTQMQKQLKDYIEVVDQMKKTVVKQNER